MSQKYVSLSELSRHSQVYETMPVAMTENLKRSIIVSTITAAVSTGGLFLIEKIPLGNPSNSILEFPIRLGNNILAFGQDIAPLLIVLNGICLVLMLGIFLMSRGLVLEVHEPIHWVAGIGSLPPLITGTITGIVIFMLVAILILQIVVYIIAAIFGLMLIVGFFCSLGS